MPCLCLVDPRSLRPGTHFLELVSDLILALVVALNPCARQDGAGVAGQALPVRGHPQGMVPPVMLLHGGERFSSGD